MKIMYLAEAYAPDIDVSALRFQEMVNTFSQQKDVGITVVVFNPQLNSERSKKTVSVSGNVEIIRYEHKYLSKLLRIAQLVSLFTVAYWIYIALREISAHKPDIVVTSIPGLAPCVAAYVASKIYKYDCCVDLRDNWFEPRLENYVISQLPWYSKLWGRVSYKISFRLFRSACKNALLVSTVYDTIFDDLKKIPGFKSPVIHVPNGVNLDEIDTVKKSFDKKAVLKKYGIPCDNGSKNIIFVGMLGGYYRPDALLTALNKIKEKGFSLNYIIVGDGDLKNKIKETAAKDGLEKQVFTPGKLAHAEVIELLLASDLAFYALDDSFPAADHALGVKIIEYIACELPILSISKDSSTVSKITSEHGIGIALNWDHLDDLGPALERMLSGNEYARRVDEYHAEFINTYNRSTNNKRLYDKIFQLYHKKMPYNA